MPTASETKTRRKPVRYVDDIDRPWQERMQNTSDWERVRSEILEKEVSEWPDQIILADLPQVPSEQIDAPIEEILGRSEGPILHRKAATLQSQTNTKEATFSKPMSTRFVRVVRAGENIMERWDHEKHGEWEKIPDTGETPRQLIEKFYGFGDSQIDEGQQFTRARKKGASKLNWKTRHNPKPKIKSIS